MILLKFKVLKVVVGVLIVESSQNFSGLGVCDADLGDRLGDAAGGDADAVAWDSVAPIAPPVFHPEPGVALEWGGRGWSRDRDGGGRLTS